MKKIVIFFLFLFSFGFENNISNPDENISENLLISNFENLQLYYYNHQIVHLKLKTITAEDGSIVINSDKNISFDVNTTTDDNVTYYSTISFELNNTFPNFIINLVDGNKTISQNIVKIKSEIRRLTPPKNFSNVLADNLKITNPTLIKYDNKKNIVYFDITFKNANIKDFHFGDKIDLKINEQNSSKYTYSAFVPNDMNRFYFYYFNLPKAIYQKIVFYPKYGDEKVSTQIDLNPTHKSYIVIIDILIGVFILLFSLLFYKNRSKVILFIIFILAGSLIILNLPAKEVIIPKGTKVHILPFEKSTIFYITKQPIKVKILYNTDDYKEIEFNNKIGWIKNEKD